MKRKSKVWHELSKNEEGKLTMIQVENFGVRRSTKPRRTSKKTTTLTSQTPATKQILEKTRTEVNRRKQASKKNRSCSTKNRNIEHSRSRNKRTCEEDISSQNCVQTCETNHCPTFS
jgi:hypothetical protein